MNIRKIAIIILTASGLSACIIEQNTSSYREVVRVPYHFSINTFFDERQEDTDTAINSRSSYPFKREEVAQILVHHMNNSLFASSPALLDMRIKNYTAIKEDGNYFISMLLNIETKNDTDRVLASGNFGCMAEEKESFELFNIIKSSVTKKEITIQNRDNKIWKNIINKCTQDIAYEFNSQIGRNN